MAKSKSKQVVEKSEFLEEVAAIVPAIRAYVYCYLDTNSKEELKFVGDIQNLNGNDLNDLRIALRMVEEMIKQSQEMKDNIEERMKIIAENDADKAELLAMAKRGDPKPSSKSRLGKQLKRFTTPG